MSLLISDVWAAAGNASANAGDGLSSMMIMGAFILIFYFFLIRPQVKRAKEHRNLVANLSKGDEVITAGGIFGKISEVTDDFLVLTIANGVDIKVQRNSVSAMVPKGTIKTN